MSRCSRASKACRPVARVAFLIVASLVSAFPVRAREQRIPVRDGGSAGARIFTSSCALCHGLDGRGGEHAPNIATNPSVQGLSDPALYQVIQNGIPAAGMPSFRSLGASGIQAVLDYLRALQGRGALAPVPGSPERGRALFFGKAACSKCHMVAGQGGFIGADLSTYARTHPPSEIRQAIVSPDKNLRRSDEIVVVTMRDGRAFSGLARNEDNFSLQLQTPDGAFHLFMKSGLASIRREPRSLMPSDYDSTLTPQQIDDLVSFLVSSATRH
ncbi:MAG: c-type cytochrome [Terriglobia bacterium]